MRQQAAWRIMKRIREEMAHRTGNLLLSGIVEADETYLGAASHVQGRGTDKVLILGAVERDGRIAAEVIDRADSETILGFVENYIPKPDGSRFISDGLSSYRALGSYIEHKVLKRYKHRFRYGIHTNTIEGAWSLLKRAWFGTHHFYRPENTQLYVAEMCYRYNSRSDPEAFDCFLEECFT